MNKIFIDTSYAVALVIDNDQHHQKAKQLVQQYRDYTFITTVGVVLEMGSFYLRGRKNIIAGAIDQFFSSKDIEIIPLADELVTKGVSLFTSRQDKEWSLVDCISFVVMRERNLDFALTFDKHFIQAGFQIPAFDHK